MPAGALAGLCPACLLAQGADTDSGQGPGKGRFEPPPVGEIAKLFGFQGAEVSGELDRVKQGGVRFG